MQIPSVPDAIPRTQSRFAAWLGRSVLSLLGWRIKGEFPNCSKFVIAVAPHTSNWDFIIAIAMKLALSVEVKYLGKHSIFFWPLSILLTRMGGIPVKRDSAYGVVGEMIGHFNRADKLVLGLAPEGTRRKTGKWKTGFLHIAHGANVPVVPLGLDFASKSILIGNAMHISADIDKELTRVQQSFAGVQAKYPDLT